jgi:uncharacterized protein (TIGR00730 family)
VKIYAAMPINSLAVFCGSKNGNNPLYKEHTVQLGKLLAKHGVTLIYGGGNVGIMGHIADTVMEHGGKVTGVIPQVLVAWERQHDGISELLLLTICISGKRKCTNSATPRLFFPVVLARSMNSLKW